MAVSKKTLRNLLGVKLAKIELVESSGVIAKSIYSVSTPGEPSELRFFPYLAEAEIYFVDQVRKSETTGLAADDMPDLLRARSRVVHRR